SGTVRDAGASDAPRRISSQLPAARASEPASTGRLRKIPLLRRLYRPRTTPYWDDPMFSFSISRHWKGPEKITHGVRYVKQGGDAAITVAYYPEGAEGWMPPVQYRQSMREAGTVEDRHILQEMSISSRSASRIGYTSYLYDKEYLLGQKVDIRYTDWIMAEDPGGEFLIKLSCPAKDYETHRPDFEDLLSTLVLRQPLIKTED
ncbi:MAG: hypothetical protein AAB578_10405, partial [Elusimicrobiota bacterium]